MKFTHLVTLPTVFTISVLAQEECPSVPDTGSTIGEPVPMIPGDIPSGCSPYEILVARGTGEPNFVQGNGKFGVIVGDPVVSNVTAVLPGARGYPVQYPASSQFITGVIRGARDVVARIASQSLRCPDQTFALIGYSQGAGVMHRAAETLPERYFDKVKALVMFGDPAIGDAFPDGLNDKALQICAAGDPVCDEGSCVYYHLTYIFPQYINPTVDYLVNAFTN